jgi:hypothetical protein
MSKKEDVESGVLLDSMLRLYWRCTHSNRGCKSLSWMHRIKEGERVRPGSREKFCAVTIMLKYRATPSITNLENSPKPLG